MDLSWDPPTTDGGAPIKNYRLFVTDPQNQYQGLTIETTDTKTAYKLKTPAAMQGRFYAVTVQAVNRMGKLSLLSDPAILEVKAQPLAMKQGKDHSAASSTANS